MLTSQAQNALLKVLEEPPEYATILLGAKSEESLLHTIVSRCQRVDVSKDSGVDAIDTLIEFSEFLDMSEGERLFWSEDFSKNNREK